MPKSEARAVVYWTQDQKAGIEPISHVPANARFEGSVTTVMFTGDKRWYPAKVVMISDDTAALTAREEELALSILEQKKRSDSLPPARNSRKRKSTIVVGVASEREVASALGTKPPVPKNLTAEQKAVVQAKKHARAHSRSGQDQLDSLTTDKIKVNLFPTSSIRGTEANDSDLSDLDEDADKPNSDEGHDFDVIMESSDDEARTLLLGKEPPALKSKWCDCTTCIIQEKYDNPTHLGLLKDVIKLFEQKDVKSKFKYLKLEPIPEGVRQVELTIGSGVHISRSTKDQIKLDYQNKPSSLVRETLYALYGKEPFKTLTITARGRLSGSYGIEEKVLIALASFIKRHVEPNKKMKVTDVVATINKRAPEWRSMKTSTPRPMKKSNKKSRSSSKVVNISRKLPPKDLPHGILPMEHPPKQLPAKELPAKELPAKELPIREVP